MVLHCFIHLQGTIVKVENTAVLTQLKPKSLQFDPNQGSTYGSQCNVGNFTRIRTRQTGGRLRSGHAAVSDAERAFNGELLPFILVTGRGIITLMEAIISKIPSFSRRRAFLTPIYIEVIVNNSILFYFKN